MSTGYISEKVPSLGGLTKFGICPKRKDTIDRFYSMWSKHDYPKLKVKKQIQIDEKFKNLLYEWEHQQKIKFIEKNTFIQQWENRDMILLERKMVLQMEVKNFLIFQIKI